MLVQLRKKAKPGSQWLVWSGVLALASIAGAIGYTFLLSRPSDPVPVSLITAERGDIESVINESGTVELRNQVTIVSPVEGAVDQVLVQPGQHVRAGQVLATLRYPERQTALATQQLQLQQQELARQQRQLTQQQQELARQQRQVALERSHQRVQETKEQLAIEERDFQNLSRLAAQGAIGRQQVQRQEDRVRTARTALRDAQAAEKDALLARQNAKIAEQTAQVAANTATVDIQRTQLERQRVVQQLQDSVITAPTDGVILNVNVKNGEGVQLRTELLTMGDPRQESVQLQLSTLDAARVRINQPARVSVIGPNAKVFDGRVQSLNPQAIDPKKNQQGGNQSSEQVTVPATVKLNAPTKTLIPGSQVNVEIVLEQQRNAVTLNSEAVQRSDKRPFVWVRDSEGRAQKRPVTTGLEGLLSVEITSGLSPGERVIIPPAEPPLKSGMAVTTEK